MGLNVGVYVKKDILILRLKGDLDDVSVSDLRIRISNYIDNYNIKYLLLNLQELNFLDSSGIGFIIGRYHQLQKKDGEIIITNINPKVDRIIFISGLAKICKIRESEEVVIKTLSN